MPTFLDGSANLAALTVPGVYIDIISPQPNLLGAPTNIIGLVGVASWGPLNAQIPMSNAADAAVNIGPPLVRSYDISSYLSASSKVGGQISYLGVRVSDGTDLAASATVQGITLTALYSGVLGNQIRFSIQSGSLAYSYTGVVSFPGRNAEQFNNVLGPTPASGTATFSANPTANDTLTIAGSAITFVASGATGLQVNIGASLAATLSNLLTLLNGSADTGLVKCTYSLSGSTNNVLVVTANQATTANAGTGGNSLTLAKVSTAITVSGATLTGGTGTWQVFWTNLAAAINVGNAFSAPSSCIVATAGVSTAVPTLSSPVTLTGGTDGASGVTDATLIGVDSNPRKGMYVLRNSLVDSFTLCDLTTPSLYASIISFALSENMLAVQGTASGDTIAGASATRINSASDSSWLWLPLGDYPTWFDDANGISRLINPSAFGVGILGNLSPQQSPLNKPLRGISATQRTNLGQTYSDAELTLINTGGIDAIIGPRQSPGGYYFSFAAGRNTSSNTGANGIEYTRMTNFLARSFKSKAAGSFIGRLQSIQPNDQTRAQAKALFDGYLAQLADPAVGLGINGQGMIDRPWMVQCDLNNNPANLQALGYLFVYVQVRYLNVIRYLVVKFQGGGNVNVTVQSTVPSPQQFAQPATASV